MSHLMSIHILRPSTHPLAPSFPTSSSLSPCVNPYSLSSYPSSLSTYQPLKSLNLTIIIPSMLLLPRNISTKTRHNLISPPQSLHRTSISSVHSTTSPTNFLLLPVFLSTLLYYPTSPIPNPTSPIPLAMSSSPTYYFSPIAATPSSPPHALLVTSDLSSSEPSFFYQASKSPLWCKAMDDEYHALISQKDWSLIPSSPTMNIIGCMWVYRIKRRPDASIY